MIGWGDLYKVVEAMVPLYAALAMGYGSVRWWGILTREQCEGVSRLVAYFCLPFFTFGFTLHTDPFAMNYKVVAADGISKVVIVLVLAAWTKFGNKTTARFCWSITSFSLTTLTNSLVVGVPMLKAMYGPMAQDLVVQLSVVQAIFWLTSLLFALELHRASADALPTSSSSLAATPSPYHVASIQTTKEEEAADGGSGDVQTSTKLAVGTSVGGRSRPSVMRRVLTKLSMNPNSYACFVGITWAFVANRWHFQMPKIMEGCVLIMSKAGTGMAMFSMGLFMALQEKTISCGMVLTAYSMILKFVAGPAAMAIGCIAVGLRGDVLRIAIIQAAVPQSITSFIFAREYELHAEVLSTAVIFGMLVSLPVLVVYYILLEILPY